MALANDAVISAIARSLRADQLLTYPWDCRVK